MIVYKLGQVIDTENMNNNHLYTYISSDNMLYKVEVNFKLNEFNEFLEELKQFSTLKSDRVENIEYDRMRKWPIEKPPYDEVIECLSSKDSFAENESLLKNPTLKKAYIKWLEYPSIYHDLKKLVEFKCMDKINMDKSIDLNFYLEKLDEYDLREEFLKIISITSVSSIEKNKLKELESYLDNEFVNVNKQIENANTYLEYGNRNNYLIKKIR